MIVIGHRETYQLPTLITVEMTAEEFDVIVGHMMHQHAQRFANSRQQVVVSKRFHRIMAIENKVVELKKVPDLLRSLSELIAVAIPPVEEAVNPPQS